MMTLIFKHFCSSESLKAWYHNPKAYQLYMIIKINMVITIRFKRDRYSDNLVSGHDDDLAVNS
jgi:hypothetical protein